MATKEVEAKNDNITKEVEAQHDNITKEVEDDPSIFHVEIPDFLLDNQEEEDFVRPSKVTEEHDNWYKVKGWYNELNFYSKVFQFFLEYIKDIESTLGWWIIMISSLTSFITMFNVDPFKLDEEYTSYYNWVKDISISFLSVITTLIASWIKKKSYIKRIQAIDKRISSLEKFIGLLDYQFRLIPKEQRNNYFDFVTKHREEHDTLAMYSNLISPSEFTYIVYYITRYNAPLVNGIWPWYDSITEKPRKGFALNIIKAYESNYSWRAWVSQIICCFKNDLEFNPLI